MAENPNLAEEKFALLQTRYRARLAERIGELKALTESEEFTTAASAHLEEIRTRSHQLSGSAGTFGFAEIGVIAGEIEREANMLTRIRSFRAIKRL